MSNQTKLEVLIEQFSRDFRPMYPVSSFFNESLTKIITAAQDEILQKTITIAVAERHQNMSEICRNCGCQELDRDG